MPIRENLFTHGMHGVQVVDFHVPDGDLVLFCRIRKAKRHVVLVHMSSVDTAELSRKINMIRLVG